VAATSFSTGVIPAKAGTQIPHIKGKRLPKHCAGGDESPRDAHSCSSVMWVPAFAGMTWGEGLLKQTGTSLRLLRIGLSQ
jgi:hypothetical protein